MQAIEFDTVVTDGVIKIPDEYRDQVRRDVKVIILVRVVLLQMYINSFMKHFAVNTVYSDSKNSLRAMRKLFSITF